MQKGMLNFGAENVFVPETMKQVRENEINVWLGGSCDYAHKERVGAAAYVMLLEGSFGESARLAKTGNFKNARPDDAKEDLVRDLKYLLARGSAKAHVATDFCTTEFRMLLKVMEHAMNNAPAGSNLVFKTNVEYLRNFDRTPSAKTANADLICKCIEAKSRLASATVRLVQYHKFAALEVVHDMATAAMQDLRKAGQGPVYNAKVRGAKPPSDFWND